MVARATWGPAPGCPGSCWQSPGPTWSWCSSSRWNAASPGCAEQAEALGLGNVEVVRSRAEDWKFGRGLDAVTARAVSALHLVPLTAPLVRDGGELILLKGAGAPAEIEAADKQIRRFKLTDAPRRGDRRGRAGRHPTRVAPPCAPVRVGATPTPWGLGCAFPRWTTPRSLGLLEHVSRKRPDAAGHRQATISNREGLDLSSRVEQRHGRAGEWPRLRRENNPDADGRRSRSTGGDRGLQHRRLSHRARTRRPDVTAAESWRMSRSPCRARHGS